MLTRAALVGAACLTACAVGRVSSTGDVTGIALGHARLMSSPCGAFVAAPRVARIEGGEFSTTFGGMLAALGAAAGAYFTGGALW